MVVKWWSSGGQVVVKWWSSGGQVVVKWWSAPRGASGKAQTPSPPAQPLSLPPQTSLPRERLNAKHCWRRMGGTPRARGGAWEQKDDCPILRVPGMLFPVGLGRQCTRFPPRIQFSAHTGSTDQRTCAVFLADLPPPPSESALSRERSHAKAAGAGPPSTAHQLFGGHWAVSTGLAATFECMRREKQG